MNNRRRGETSNLFSLNSSADALIAELSLKQLGWRTFGTLVLLRGMARTVVTHISWAEKEHKAGRGRACLGGVVLEWVAGCGGAEEGEGFKRPATNFGQNA